MGLIYLLCQDHREPARMHGMTFWFINSTIALSRVILSNSCHVWWKNRTAEKELLHFYHFCSQKFVFRQTWFVFMTVHVIFPKLINLWINPSVTVRALWYLFKFSGHWTLLVVCWISDFWFSPFYKVFSSGIDFSIEFSLLSLSSLYLLR